MKRAFLLLSLACALMGCKSQVAFEEAHNYFVRNDVVQPVAPLITSQAAFDAVFGCAPVMGKNGLPTQIDFARQFAIAVVLPETSRPTTITPVALTETADSLRLTYDVREEAPSTWTMVPCCILVVDKAHEKPISLQRR